MVSTPSALEASGRGLIAPSTIGMAQRSACDRCRGQKLRCTRNFETQASCNRCERVGAQCIVGLLPRMGRPARLDTQGPRERPGGADAPTASTEARAQASNQLNELGLPSAPETQHQQESVDHSYMSTFDIPFPDLPFPDLEQHDTDVFGLISFSASDGEIVSNASRPGLFDVEQSKISSLSNPSGSSAQSRASEHPLDPALTSGPQLPAPVAAPSAHHAVSNRSESLDHVPPNICQVPLDQLSRLNLELHRHLSQTKVAKDLDSANACISIASCPQDLDSLLPIGLMIKNLQTFQNLLDYSSTLGRTTLTSREIASAFDDDARAAKRLRIRRSSSTVQSRELSSPVSPNGFANWTQSSTMSAPDFSPPLSGPRGTLTRRDRKQIIHALDLPTRMLFITCYINLTRFCRRVVSNIRQCLVSFDQEIIFARLSDLLISGVSLEQDGHLQIFVLIEVISRMLDVISAGLGYSKEYSILASNSRQRDLGSLLSDNATTPTLMESVMKEEERSGAQDISGGGISALQEEIWELKKLLQ